MGVPSFGELRVNIQTRLISRKQNECKIIIEYSSYQILGKCTKVFFPWSIQKIYKFLHEENVESKCSLTKYDFWKSRVNLIEGICERGKNCKDI